jgi:hypothetical protein
MTRRYLGSWALPSGNSADVYWATDGGLSCHHIPAILAAVADATGQPVLGVTG